MLNRSVLSARMHHAVRCSLIGGLLLTTYAGAQEFPTRAVRLVAPFPPGSVTDVVARPLSQKLAEIWKQPVVIDNRLGAGGIIGAAAVAAAPADGYTILMGSNGTNAINISLYPSLPYDAAHAFAAVTQIATSNLILVVPPSLGVSNVRELIALAKAKPDELTFGSGGSGTTPHLAAELFNTMAGLKIRHVPYKGTPQAMIDVLAGRVSIIFSNGASALPHMRTGKLLALAVTSPQRDSKLPEVPAIAEVGYADFAAEAWVGAFVPSATAPAIVEKISQQIRAVLAAEDVTRSLATQGLVVRTSTPAAFSAYVAAETVKWAKVVKASGAKPD